MSIFVSGGTATTPESRRQALGGGDRFRRRCGGGYRFGVGCRPGRGATFFHLATLTGSPPIPLPLVAIPDLAGNEHLLGRLLFLGVLAVIVTAIFLAASFKQSVQGRGSKRRWGLTAAGCTGLAGLPFLCGLVLGRFLPPTAEGLMTTIGALVSGVCVLWFVLGLKPFAWVTGRPLPEVTDGPLLVRTREIAERVGVPCPVVRQIPGGGEMFGPGAWMSGLAAPVLVLTDAILLRFTPEERDAIIAHELGHIANRSLWWHVAALPLAGTALVLCLPRIINTHDSPLPPQVAASIALLGLAILVGLRRTISRVLEYDSDRRAGLAAGFSNMAAALLKLHVLHPIRSDGWFSWLFYAVATHPSRDERIAELARRAPADDPVRIPAAFPLARRRRWAVRVAFVFWLAALATVYRLFGADDPGRTILGNWLLFLVGVTPAALQWAAVRQQAAIQHRRYRAPSKRRRGLWIAVWVIVGAIGAFAILALTEAWSKDYRGVWVISLMVTLLTIVGSLLAMLWLILRGADPHESGAVANQALVLLYENRPVELLELLASKPQRVQAVPGLQLMAATAEGMLGQVKAGIARLERLVDAGRAPPAALMNLVVLRLEAGEADQALVAARAFTKRLPRDPLGPIYVAVACCERGKWDEAEREAARSERLREGQADTLVIRARVAAGRGDLALADTLLDQAEALAPADSGIRFTRFRLAVERGDAAAARAVLTPLRTALDATPWLLLQRRTARLVERLEALETPATESATPSR